MQWQVSTTRTLPAKDAGTNLKKAGAAFLAPHRIDDPETERTYDAMQIAYDATESILRTLGPEELVNVTVSGESPVTLDPSVRMRLSVCVDVLSQVAPKPQLPDTPLPEAPLGPPAEPLHTGGDSA